MSPSCRGHFGNLEQILARAILAVASLQFFQIPGESAVVGSYFSIAAFISLYFTALSLAKENYPSRTLFASGIAFTAVGFIVSYDLSEQVSVLAGYFLIAAGLLFVGGSLAMVFHALGRSLSSEEVASQGEGKPRRLALVVGDLEAELLYWKPALAAVCLLCALYLAAINIWHWERTLAVVCSTAVLILALPGLMSLMLVLGPREKLLIGLETVLLKGSTMSITISLKDIGACDLKRIGWGQVLCIKMSDVRSGIEMSEPSRGDGLQWRVIHFLDFLCEALDLIGLRSYWTRAMVGRFPFASRFQYPPMSLDPDRNVARFREIIEANEVDCGYHLMLEDIYDIPLARIGGVILERAEPSRLEKYRRVGEPDPQPEEMKSVAHVFLSYVREDSEAVDCLSLELIKRGVEVWVDREKINPGQRWKPAIQQAIRQGGCFVACFSKNSCSRQRSYMNEELTMAIEEMRLHPHDRTWFIPVRLAECDIPDKSIGAGETLSDIQFVDLHRNWGQGIEKLARVLLGDVGQSQNPATPAHSAPPLRGSAGR